MNKYETFMSMNKTKPNGGSRGCFGWRGFCDLSGVKNSREAATVALNRIINGSIEHVDTVEYDGRKRRVYRDGFGRYIAVEKVS